jgi:hypothetical protein
MKKQDHWDFPWKYPDSTTASPEEPKSSHGYKGRKCDNIYG